MHSPAARAHAMALLRAGHNDCEVSRRTGIPRTTIRDWRRPRYVPRPRFPDVVCPRCWRPARPMAFTVDDYAELLGLYLGDGHVVELARTARFRLFLDSRHAEIAGESKELLERCLPHNAVGVVYAHDGRMTILNVYSSHLT